MMYMASSKNFWREWLQYYKSHQSLWDVDSPDYKNRTQRQRAYRNLASMAKVVYEDANEEFVRMRINNFRTSYRKEVKKVVAARENGLLYKPKLFYYDILNSILQKDGEGADLADMDASQESCSEEEEDPFASLHAKTRDSLEKFAAREKSPDEEFEQHSDVSVEENVPKTPRKTTNNIKSLKASDSRQSNANVDINVSSLPQRIQKTANMQKLKRRRRSTKYVYPSDEESEKEVAVPKIPRDNGDEWDILGRRFATHFRNMKSTQRLLAEKIISDVCIYARLNQLTLRSKLTVEMTSEHKKFNTDNRRERLTSKDRLTEESIDLDSKEYLYTM